MACATHRFVESRDTALAETLAAFADVPEWAMTSSQWIAHQERLLGADWRSEIDRMDAETDDGSFYDFFGDVPFDGAPDLTPASRVPVGMLGEVGL